MVKPDAVADGFAREIAADFVSAAGHADINAIFRNVDVVYTR